MAAPSWEEHEGILSILVCRGFIIETAKADPSSPLFFEDGQHRVGKVSVNYLVIVRKVEDGDVLFITEQSFQNMLFPMFWRFNVLQCS